MGLIQTCQRNGVNPWDYLTEIQRNHTLAKEKPEDWVPWKFLAELKERFQKFGLTLHPDKTRLIEFGRFAASSRKWRGQGKPETFDFLGFTHICGKTRKGAFMVHGTPQNDEEAPTRQTTGAQV